MQYILLICLDESFRPPEALELEVIAWVEELRRRGMRISGDRFRPVSDAKTVRVRGGEVLLADGPFAQTKEQILGYELIESASLDEAVRAASQHPMARLGPVEVRQIWKTH
jgi:hypothetical protein